MKFSKMPYSRVTVEDFRRLADASAAQIESAATASDAEAAIYDYYDKSMEYETSMALCYIRRDIDTRDAFYKAEQDYYDENAPLMEIDFQRVTDTILGSRHRAELEKSLGALMFRKLENQKRLFDEKIIPEMQEENRLSSRYSEIIGGAEVAFDGKTLNLSQLDPYRVSPDRDTRRRANETYFGFFAERQAEFDDIFAKLTALRDTTAKKLNFNNGVDLGYAQMERFDYDEAMVKVYRDEVKRHIVPLVAELKERQRARLGLDRLYYYDNAFSFKTGNPKPQGTPDELVEAARKMYRGLSPECGEFFEYMIENELMDLLAKPGKNSGGFCATLPEYKSPFIFANFTGTKDDVDVLTHEAGHALQSYLSMREIRLPVYHSPTYESCEIHSMSMELLTRPYMHDFFGGDTEKFLFMQLEDILNFLPYGCLVDDFQHHVYNNPKESPDERAAAWLKLEGEYMPHLDFAGNTYLESGRRWQRQSHIYQRPFYYIDYTLAQVCAIQFFARALNNDASALPDYLKLCRAGGTRTFVALTEFAGLQSPFREGVLSGAADALRAELNKIDDMGF